MNNLVTAKHWQIFLLLIVGMLLSNFYIEGWLILTKIIKISGLFILLSWPLMLGLELFRYLPQRIEMSSHLFIINGFLLMLMITAVAIIFDEKVTIHGLKALPGLYILYAYAHLHLFPAKVLKTLENGREASLGDYVGYAALIFFWPVGIWFLQPRINKAVKEQETSTFGA